MLTIVSVTRAEHYSFYFLQEMSELAKKIDGQFVIGADGKQAAERLLDTRWAIPPIIVTVQSKGYIESVLDEVLKCCTGDYILRLDDDEKCSHAMVRWICERKYEEATHWKFPRAHLWTGYDSTNVLLHSALWPDHQTRLSIREMSGGRRVIHCGSPFGGGEVAPVVIEHHKFRVKSLAERREIVARYDRISRNAGTGMAIFSTPEDVVNISSIPRAPLGCGYAEEIK